MSSPSGQLPLGIKLQDQAVFNSFYAGSNRELVDHLMAEPSLSGGVTWIWGKTGTGKSHLLQATSVAHEGSAYFPLNAMKQVNPEALDGYANYRLLCLDDIDSIAGSAQWEEAMFSVFNGLVVEQHGTLIVSSTRTPRQIKFGLKDLRSRLLSGPVYRLHALNDKQLISALQLRATCRGLELPSNTAQFLINHYQRDMSSLCRNLDVLDTASLVQKRKLTIPLVKAALTSRP